MGDGAGLYVRDGFINSGTATATGTGYGIKLERGDFVNSGRLTLASNGGQALYFDQTPNAYQFMAQSGSSLILAGPGPAMAFSSDFIGTLSIESNASLTLLSANEVAAADTFVVAQNVGSTGSNAFVLPNSAVFGYAQRWAQRGSTGDFVVDVTRRAWASDLPGGQGGRFVESLEKYFLANGAVEALDTPAWGWLELLHDLNSGSTAGEVKRRGQTAARLNTAQATGQSLYLVQDADRRITGLFYDELSDRFRAAAPSAGGGGTATSLGLRPLYLPATEGAGDGSRSGEGGGGWGLSLTAAHSPQENLNFGLGFHFLKGDFDGGREYQADSTAWGLNLGLAAGLGQGRSRPLLTAVVSHTRHDFDQTRRQGGFSYRSSPDIEVTAATLGLARDFYLTEEESFILRPQIGLDWTRTSLGRYEEHSSGPRALSVDSEDFDSLRGELGTALVWKPAEPVELELRAAWLHEFGDRSPLLTSAVRDVPGLSLYTPRADNSRDSANVGASVALKAAGGLSLSLDYDGLFNSNLDSHQFGASIKYSF